MKSINFLTFASIYSNRDSWYNVFIRQLYRKRVIFMKKFLVPVSCLMLRRVEVESESVEKLLDDIRHNRLNIKMPELDEMEYVEDSLDIDRDFYIIDMETDELWGF